MFAIPLWVYWVAAAAGAAATIYSSNQQAKRLEANARLYEEDMRLRERQTIEQERLMRQRLAGVVGEQTVAFSKGGVTMSGTPIMVQENTLHEGELDIYNMKYQGMMEANRLKYMATAAKEDASTTRTAGYLSAVGSLFGAAGSRYSSPQPAPASQSAPAARNDVVNDPSK